MKTKKLNKHKNTMTPIIAFAILAAVIVIVYLMLPKVDKNNYSRLDSHV